MNTDGHIVGLVFCNDIIQLAKSVFDTQKIFQKIVPQVEEMIKDFMKNHKNEPSARTPEIILLTILPKISNMVEEINKENLTKFEQKLQAQIFELVKDLSDRVHS